MSKPNIKVESQTLSDASSNIGAAADDAKTKTAAGLHSAGKLGAAAGHKVFAALVDGVLDELRAHLPDDIEQLIKSYANALLALDSATGATDQALAQKWKSGGAGSAVEAAGLAVVSVGAGGAAIVVQGSSPALQGGPMNIQGGGTPERHRHAVVRIWIVRGLGG